MLANFQQLHLSGRVRFLQNVSLWFVHVFVFVFLLMRCRFLFAAKINTYCADKTNSEGVD